MALFTCNQAMIRGHTGLAARRFTPPRRAVWSIWLMLAACTAIPATYAATRLSDPDAVNRYRESQSGASSPNRSSSSDDDYTVGSTTTSGNSSTASGTNQVPGVIERIWLSPPPETWTIPRGFTIAEIGWQDWDISSSSGSGNGPGGGYSGDYRIDPVQSLSLGGAARWGNWTAGLGYLTSPDSSEGAELLLGSIAYFRPGRGAWWILSGESGRVQGIATTENYSGQTIEADIDTDWETVSLEWCRWSGGSLGLVYEDLRMPSVLSLEDANGPVIAIFDESARWTTVALQAGYDSALKRLSEQREGFGVGYTAYGRFGFGKLDVDEAAIHQIAGESGYRAEINSGVATGSLEGRLGLTYTGRMGALPLQVFVGGRGRLTGWSSAGSTSEDFDRNDELYLQGDLGLVTVGAFARIVAMW